MVNLSKSPTVGSLFTTQKSGTVGTVQEVIQNQNGSLRVRLDVNGQDRWTTVKQSSLGWGQKMIPGNASGSPLEPHPCQTRMVR